MSSRRVLSFATFVLTSLCLARRTCSRQMREEFNKNIVEQGLGGLLGDGDASAAAYFAEDYIEHNPTGPNGLEFVVDFAVTNRPENFTYEIGGVWAEGDFVVVSGRASFAGSPSVTADIYKVCEYQSFSVFFRSTCLVPELRTTRVPDICLEETAVIFPRNCRDFSVEETAVMFP